MWSIKVQLDLIEMAGGRESERICKCIHNLGQTSKRKFFCEKYLTSFIACNYFRKQLHFACLIEFCACPRLFLEMRSTFLMKLGSNLSLPTMSVGNWDIVNPFNVSVSLCRNQSNDFHC